MATATRKPTPPDEIRTFSEDVWILEKEGISRARARRAHNSPRRRWRYSLTARLASRKRTDKPGVAGEDG